MGNWEDSAMSYNNVISELLKATGYGPQEEALGWVRRMDMATHHQANQISRHCEGGGAALAGSGSRFHSEALERAAWQAGESSTQGQHPHDTESLPFMDHEADDRRWQARLKFEASDADGGVYKGPLEAKGLRIQTCVREYPRGSGTRSRAKYVLGMDLVDDEGEDEENRSPNVG